MPVIRFRHFRVVLPSADEFLLPNALRVMNAQQLEKDSVTLRIEEQTQLHHAAIQRRDHETAKAIKYHLVAERTKRMYQKLRYM